MAWYWWLLELSANLVEAGMLVFFIKQFSEPRYRESRWPFCISAVVVFGIITTGNFILQLHSAVTILLSVLGSVGVAFLAYRGSVVSRFLLPVLVTAINLITEVLSLGILQVVFVRQYADFVDETSMRMLGIIISKVLLIAMVYATGRLVKKEQVKIPLSYGLCLLLVPAITIVCMIAIGQYVINPSTGELSALWFALSAFGLLFLNILILYLFQALMNYSRNQSRLQLMVQQSEMLNKHLNETCALQEETHKIWHDMKNHFTVIQWMVKQHNFEKLESYMQTLNDAVASAMPKYQTGNNLFDALLNTKAVEAKNSGIEFIVNAAMPPKLSINDLDLNIVVSNALDNAIEACKRLPEGGDRYVSIDAMIRNDHLFLTVKNPYAGEVRVIGGKLESTKTEAGRHGIGVGNMMRAVEKYDGHILTDFRDGLFVLSATMYCTISG